MNPLPQPRPIAALVVASLLALCCSQHAHAAMQTHNGDRVQMIVNDLASPPSTPRAPRAHCRGTRMWRCPAAAAPTPTAGARWCGSTTTAPGRRTGRVIRPQDSPRSATPRSASPAAHKSSRWYATSRADLPNTVVATYLDAGYYLKWNRAAFASGSTWAIQAFEVWTRRHRTRTIRVKCVTRRKAVQAGAPVWWVSPAPRMDWIAPVTQGLLQRRRLPGRPCLPGFHLPPAGNAAAR